MKFIIFFIYIPLVYSEYHRIYTAYTGINVQKAPGIQEFIAETRLDGEQIDYYDSNIKKLIPKQDWMEDYASKDMWREDTAIRKHVQKIYRSNLRVIMQRFNQSGGVHMYQRMYGCEYDDETEESQGFDRYIYDGQEFITLDMEEFRYTAHVPQATATVMKWNDDIEQLTLLKQYYNHECIYWLTYLLALRKASFKRRESLKANLALMVCVMGLLTALVIVIAVGFKTKRISVFKRVSSQEETYIDKNL